MGASVSKTAVDVVNEAIVNVVVEASQNTSAYIEASQNVSISGFSLFSSQKQKLATSVAALQSVTIDNELISKISQEIQASAQAEGLILDPAFANTDTQIRNTIAANVSDETVQACASGVAAEQGMDISGTSIIAIQSQVVDAFAECKQLKSVSSNIAQDLFQDVTAESIAESQSIFGDIITIGIIIIVILALIITALVVAYIMRKKKKKTDGMSNLGTPNQESEQPEK